MKCQRRVRRPGQVESAGEVPPQHTDNMWPALLVVTAVAVLPLALVWALQRRLIYLPSTTAVPPAAQVLPGARDVVLTTSDGLRLGGWFLPGDGPPDRWLAVLVANGNAGDRSLRAPLATELARRGLAVLLFDYRGYGGNPGRPIERGVGRDVRAAYDFLVEEAGVRADRLLYYGESLGTAVVTELATERPPAGLVLRSPFVDLRSVGKVHYPFLPVRTLLRDTFPLVSQLRRVAAPVTVVYGAADSIVPPEQSRSVAAAAPRLSQLIEVPTAGHDGPLLDAAVVDAIAGLAEQVACAS